MAEKSTRQPSDEETSREPSTAGAVNPRNVPTREIDPTPPQEELPEADLPTTQDDLPVDPKIIIDPPPHAPEVRRERITG